MQFRRINWLISIEYTATVAQLNTITTHIKKCISSDAFASKEEATNFVVVKQFNQSSIDIEIYCFTHTTDWLAWLAIQEQLIKDIKDIVEKSGTYFAFPTQTLYTVLDLQTKLKNAQHTT